jgi:hypothetical protein
MMMGNINVTAESVHLPKGEARVRVEVTLFMKTRME